MLKHASRVACLMALCLAVTVTPANAQKLDPAVLKAEEDRVKAVDKVRPAVVAIFAQRGGGSGVLISDDGYALSNWHVTRGAGPIMKCGLADGVLYDAVLVGQDKVGDVALIKLLPKKKGDKFPFAIMADSDTVKEGDWSIAMGNPFLLATDFKPTVTFGLVSGVHRYQYPAGTLLEYTDCIQIDTSINPGNSGGPLFNMNGELIGINGRGSFDKRGRINSGVGYAISINQIKNFLGHLKAGFDWDHASLGALFHTQNIEGGIAQMVCTSILEDSDVFRRGLDLDDQLISFAGRPMASINQYKNVMGIYPRGWRVPLTYRRGDEVSRVLVRLMGVQRRVLSGNDDKKIKLPKIPTGSAAAKMYEPKKGFANYYFNRYEKKRLMDGFQGHGDFRTAKGTWKIHGDVQLKQLRSKSRVHITITEKKSKDGKRVSPVVRMDVDGFPYALEPIKEKQEVADLKVPPGSGGLLAGLFLYQQLLTSGEEAFGKDFHHGGYEPVYPPRLDRTRPKNLNELREDAEVIKSRLGVYLAKWYFSRKDQRLVALEVRLEEGQDPCEIYFSDYRKDAKGRLLPYRMQVYHGDSFGPRRHYGTYTLTSYEVPG